VTGPSVVTSMVCTAAFSQDRRATDGRNRNADSGGRPRKVTQGVDN
jgi:hypothetical protein